MPEGDTIFRAARTLHRALAGHAVTRFETQYAHLARVHDDAPITGRLIERVDARGKHLLIWMSAPGVGNRVRGAGGRVPGATSEAEPRHGGGALVLRTHMRMSGSWHIYRTGEPWQRSSATARIVIGTATFVAVAFSVPVAEFVSADGIDRDEALGRLGPDVLAEDFDPVAAAARLAASGLPTAAEALLHQPTVAGIGNVYKSEVLFLAGVDPFAAPAAVTAAQWARIMRDARAVMRVNVVDDASSGVVTSRGPRRTTGRSNTAQSVYVYERTGQPCRRCGTAIRMRHHGEHNRSTYWFPTCQPSMS